MICVVINRDLDPVEINELREWAAKREHKLFSLIELSPELKDIGVVKFEIPPELKGEINLSILAELIGFGDKIINGKRISDYLSIENAGLWYYQRYRTYIYLKEVAYEHAGIEMMTQNYDKVITFTNSIDLANYSDFSSEVIIRKSKEAKSQKQKYLSLINYVLFVLRSFFSLFKISGLKKTNHIVLDHAQRQSSIDINTLKVVKDNYILSYLFEKLDSEFLILSFTQMPKFLTGGKFRIRWSHFTNTQKNKKRFYGEYILLRAMLSFRIRKKLKDISNSLSYIYNEIENSDLTSKEKIIISHYRALHSNSMLYFLKYYAFDRFFSKYSFKTISAIDENSPEVKSILDAARAKKIRTIGIQHGAISDLSVGYVYSAYDKEKNVMADHTLVWGQKWKDLLINDGNFPEKSIEITGQIRTDIIPKLRSLNKIRDIEKIPEGKKLVVFASQPQPDSRLRRQAAVDIFSAVKDMTEVFLIVKLHPGERNDTAYYDDLAKEAGCLNYKLMIDVDLFLLLSACDILITCYSTVGIEAVYFNKPLIIHDPLKLDMQLFHKEGVAFQATNEMEMQDFINKILSGQLSINQQAYENFISGYAYKIDGKASERSLDFIKSVSS